MKHTTLEQVIRQNIRLSPRPNGKGWFSTLCKVCNDHGKKGDRGGFRFEGSSCWYHCFNCNHTAAYIPADHDNMPDRMQEVLHSFGILPTDWQPVLYSALADKAAGQLQPSQQRKKINLIEPTEIQLPNFFKPLEEIGDEWCEYAKKYLEQRGIDWATYPFYTVLKSDHPDNKRWYGRLIIPTYKDNKLIFYQGRDLTDLHLKKYLSVNTAKDNVMYGFDQLFRKTDDPLYVVEGFFDAYMLQGVAVYGNVLTDAQIQWLNQSRRPKIVIPDKFGDGHLLAKQAIDLNWKVSFPDIGQSKDVNEAMTKYGLIYTLKTIREQTYEGFEGEARIGIYCKNDPGRSSKTHKTAPKRKG